MNDFITEWNSPPVNILVNSANLERKPVCIRPAIL